MFYRGSFKVIPPKFIPSSIKDRELAAYFTLSACFFSLLQFQTTYLIDRDLYYHIQIANLMLEHGIIYQLPQMALSFFGDHFVHFHFIFQALQSILILLTDHDLLLAAKIGTILFSGFSTWCLGNLLKDFNVSHRWFWIAFFLLASPIFTGRLMFGRGVTLFLGILFLFLKYLRRRNLKALGVITFVAVWTYPGFPVLFITALLFTMTEAIENGTIEWKCMLVTMAGIISALILHPSFPHQFEGYYVEFFIQFFHGKEIEPIAEWLPAMRDVQIIAIFVPMLFLLGRVIVTTVDSSFEKTLLCLVVLNMASLTMAVKPLEYFFPFVTIFAATANVTRISERMKMTICVLFALQVLFFSFPETYGRTLLQAKMQNVQHDFDAAQWLENNTPKRSLVLLPWDAFPTFFFKNTHNYYPFGLNPAYAYSHNAQKYLLLKEFYSGELDKPSLAIGKLNARYAVLEKPIHRVLISKLKQDKTYVARVFENQKYEIFELVRTEQGR